MDDESEFLVDEYHSEDEVEKVESKIVTGGGNLAPEVLKMLQQMTPSTPIEQDKDEPDEIKVSLPNF
jgi:hypothetical protein